MNISFYKQYFIVSILILIFCCGVFRQVDLPGIYMDGVNPDYLAAQTLNPQIKNTNWKIPTVIGPVLGNLYHGVENYYVDLGVFKVLGESVTSLRIAQSLFGGAIIVMVYFLLLNISGNIFISFFCAALLSTNIAFISSFRTQFYIVLSGEVWLLASVLALRRETKFSDLLAGIFYGLSIYAYFVFIFFFPAIACIAIFRQKRFLRRYFFGIAIGLIPYLIGYLSLIVALGGISNAVNWIHNSIISLAPLSSNISFDQRIKDSIMYTYLAITNIGNNLMIFKNGIHYLLGNVQAIIFMISIAASAIIFRKKKEIFIVLLPIAYIVMATIFGNRLWVHHYSVMVPFEYLLFGMFISVLVKSRTTLIFTTSIVLTMLCINIAQSNVFFKKLDVTGGVGKYTDAVNIFALNALHKQDALYVFPEWGFYMPFDYLTSNSVPYILQDDPMAISTYKMKMHKVVLAYWDYSSSSKYESILKKAGVSDIKINVHLQRNKIPAFYTITGEF